MTGEKLFGLTDGEYWSDPWKSLGKVAWSRIDDEVSALAIDCPDRIAFQEQSSFPLLALQTGPSKELHHPRFQDHAVVTALGLDDDRLYAARAFTDILPSDAPEPSPGFAAAEFEVDLREALSLPWRQGTYVVRTFLRDRVSNECVVTLGAAQSSYDDPEVRQFLEEARIRRPRRGVFPEHGDSVVDYTPRAGSPLPPDEVGLVMRADRVVVRGPGRRARVDVSFKLPVRPTDLAPPPPDATRSESPLRAVAAISILVIGSDAPSQIPLSLLVPSYQVEGPPDAPVARGAFSVDLLAHPAVASRCQTYFVFAFAGRRMAGPALVAVVDEA